MPLRLLVAGLGARGSAYARLALATGQAVVIGVAEPRADQRDRIGDELGIPAGLRFDDWRPMLARERFADAVIIATPDRDHVGPFAAAARAGYAVLLEKPIAVTREACRELAAAARAHDASAVVCHVLRYAPLTDAVKRLLDGGAIGRVVSVQHLEPVGYWHFAHSYVRGNWRREDLSSPFLLAKCTHDIDWLGYIVGSRPVRVSSFGSLSHFRPEEAPPGAGERCTACAVEPSCPYSALKAYAPGRPAEGEPDPRRAYFAEVVDPGGDRATLWQALETGPYGRCVYRCDNDAVDHQVVAIEYENGTTATLTATAFTEATARRTRIFGTHGELSVEGGAVVLRDFLAGAQRSVTVPEAATAAEGHGGGDRGLIDAWVRSLAEGDPGRLPSSLEESLVSHEVVFAAEDARHRHEVIEVPAGTA